MIIQNNERTATATCEKDFRFVYDCQEKTQHPIKLAMIECLDFLTLNLFQIPITWNYSSYSQRPQRLWCLENSRQLSYKILKNICLLFSLMINAYDLFLFSDKETKNYDMVLIFIMLYIH